VEGPGGRPTVVSRGLSVDAEIFDRPFAPPNAGPVRAARIDWTYDDSVSAEAGGRFHSALVASLGPSAAVTGTLAAYAIAPGAFGPEHAVVLRELVATFATGLRNARRFADVESRLLSDPVTGVVASRRGYEYELEREIARASRTGRPLSVVFVGVRNGAEATHSDAGSATVDELARLVSGVTRRTDIPCRRSDRDVAILLPETRESGATLLTARIRNELTRALGNQSTIAVGHVEWLPDESIEGLDARVDAALTAPLGSRSTATPEWAARARAERRSRDAASTADAARPEPNAALRRDVLESVASEVRDAHRFGRSLALAVVDVDGLDDLVDRLDREAADAVLGTIAQRLSDGVGSGSIHRLGAGEFVLVLSGATADDAEMLLGTLHAHDREDEIGGLTLSAGITELVERDGAQTALGRAEHALWQAKQAGRGTVVVAVPGGRKPPLE
jgi:diguanylate cyclase (GGDEF)-like protein